MNEMVNNLQTVELGGLWIKDLQSFKEILLVKWEQRYAIKNESLWCERV